MKDFHVFGDGAGVPGLNDGNTGVVQRPDKIQLVADGKRDAVALCAVPQGRIENFNLRGKWSQDIRHPYSLMAVQSASSRLTALI